MSWLFDIFWHVSHSQLLGQKLLLKLILLVNAFLHQGE
jgi:hypothetical protein